MCLDVTGSMSAMLEGAKRGLRSAWSGIQQAIGDEQDAAQVAVICYKDYGDRRVGEGADAALQFTGRAGGPGAPRPLFSRDRELVHCFLQPHVASGGGDTPEMVELALAAATVLPWSGKIQTMYLALDAPPHCHGHPSACMGDQWPTVQSVREEQTQFGRAEKRILDLAVHPECWMTQAIILARLGVIINPMICTSASDVVFFAAFLAELTGGQAVFLDSCQLGPPATGSPWQGCAHSGDAQGDDLLEKYVREYTALEIADVRALQNPGLSPTDRARAEEANAVALMGLPEKYRMQVPGKEVSEAMAKLFAEENIKRDLVFSFPGKGTAAPIEERAPGAPEDEAFLRLPGFDESAFQAASRLLPKYNRALAEAVRQRMGVADAEHMKGYKLESLCGMSQAAVFTSSRCVARTMQQYNYAQISKSSCAQLRARTM
jgi:hypothetical protein